MPKDRTHTRLEEDADWYNQRWFNAYGHLPKKGVGCSIVVLKL